MYIKVEIADLTIKILDRYLDSIADGLRTTRKMSGETYAIGEFA
jgi:hypothetical protein